MKVLHIDSSMRNDHSISKELSALFVHQLKEKYSNVEVDYLDLGKDTPRHPSALFIKANYSPVEDRTNDMLQELVESEALVDRMVAADTCIIGMPMHNFSVPSIFKAFIDNIVRVNRTFKLTDTGVEGLLSDKKVFVINTRGADFNDDHMAPMDQLRPYLKTIFNFMGITDLTFIDVSPVQFSHPETRENAIRKGKEEIIQTVQLLNIK